VAREVGVPHDMIEKKYIFAFVSFFLWTIFFLAVRTHYQQEEKDEDEEPEEEESPEEEEEEQPDEDEAPAVPQVGLPSAINLLSCEFQRHSWCRPPGAMDTRVTI